MKSYLVAPKSTSNSFIEAGIKEVKEFKEAN
jgi:hypothetical protein